MANSPFLVGGPWSGGVTDTKATIKASIKSDVHLIRLVIAQDHPPTESGTPLPFTSQWSDPGERYDHNVFAFELTGLTPDTQYHYAFVIDGRIADNGRGKLKTFPPVGRKASFKFAFGSCSKYPDHPVYGQIQNERDLLFFFHLGDFHYGNQKDRPIDKRLERFDDALNGTDMGALFKNLPLAYTWDDHDFYNNDSGGEGHAVGAANARDAYDVYVPHYQLFDRNHGVFQSFTVGRVLFVLTDLRFNQSPYDKPPHPGPKTVFGDDQLRWLEDRLDEGKQMDLIVMTSSFPYIVNSTDWHGSWGNYPEARIEFANIVKRKKVRNLCVISGDAHMLAIDDGSNSGYATVVNPGEIGKGGFPIFHAASLNSSLSAKGGPYSKGRERSDGGREGNGIPGIGQYGLFEVSYKDRDGADIEVPRLIWRGRRSEGGSVRDVIWQEFSANPTYGGF